MCVFGLYEGKLERNRMCMLCYLHYLKERGRGTECET